MRLTEKAHHILSAHLKPGDYAIDATAGNGHDTLFLTQAVGQSGQVLAVDLQANAIEATRQKLAAARVEARTQLQEADHADCLETELVRSTNQVDAIVFNLGYLPGSDKSVQTHAAQTLRALKASAKLLRSGGQLCVTAYRAHPGGEDEAAAVEAWMHARKAEDWRIECHLPPSKNQPPVLWVAVKP